MPFGIDPNYVSLATGIATKAGVDPNFVLSVMSPESAGNPNAVSNKGARGLMQLMPATARDLGVQDPSDPVQNITGGVNYIKQLAGQFGDNPRLVAAAYNAGPGAVSKSLASTGDIPNYPETRGYVNKVTTNLSALRVPGQPAPKTPAAPGADPGLNESDFEPMSDADLKAAAAKSPAAPAAKSAAAPGADPSLNPDDFADVSQTILGRGPAATADRSVPTMGADGKPVSPPPLAPAPPVIPLKQQIDDMMTGKTSVAGLRLPVPGHSTDGLGRALGLTARDAMQGVAGIGDIPSQAVVAPINAATGANIPSLRTIASNAADAMGLPTPQGNEVIPNQIAESMTGAGGVAGLAKTGAKLVAGAAAPVLSSVLGELGSNVGGQVAGAATGTAAASGVDKAIGPDVTPGARMVLDTIAGIAGGAPVAGGVNAANSMRGGAPVQSIANLAANGDRAALTSAATAAKVPLSMGDASGPQSVTAGLERVNNLVPLGGKAVAAQTAETQIARTSDALHKLADQYKPNGLPAGSDVGSQATDRFLVNDLRSEYAKGKANAKAAYDQVPVALAKAGVPDAVPLDATRAAALALEKQFPEKLETLSPSAPLLSTLKSLTAATDPQPLTILGANGKPMQVDPAMQAVLQKMAAQGRATAGDGSPLFGGPVVHSFNDARDLQQGIGGLLNTAEKQVRNGNGNPQLVASLNKLYGAVSQDVEGYLGSASPDALAAYNKAKGVFQDQVLPYRADPRINTIVSSKATKTDFDLAAQGIARNLFNPAQSERAPYAMSLLSKDGQDAAAYAVLKKAADAATSKNSPVGFRPGAGAKALDPDNDPALAAIIAAHPDLKNEIGKVRALINVGRSAADTLANPKTGNRLMLPSMLGALGTAAHFGATHAGAHGIAPWLAAVGVPAAVVGGSRALARASVNLPKSLLQMDPGTLGQAVLPSMRGGLLGQP